MQLFDWLSKKIRNGANSSPVIDARATTEDIGTPTFCFVSATRTTEKEFWSNTALGLSLAPLLSDPRVRAEITYENTNGLPAVYNRATRAGEQDILIFLHDDIWLEDPYLLQKLEDGMRQFDIVGLAGNRRRVPYQPAWLFTSFKNENFVLDEENLSGSVAHGVQGHYELSTFGPTPAECKLLDGLFIAAKRKTLIKARVHFDERFDFQFYDMDFCRTAESAGLSQATWPIQIIHESSGAFGSPAWLDAHFVYLKKWGD